MPSPIREEEIWKHWSARDYLNYYYSGAELDEDEVEVLKYTIATLRRYQTTYSAALEVGCGPMLGHGIPLVPFVQEIHFADYLEGNLVEIAKWIGSARDAFNWDLFFRRTAEFEGGPADDAAISRRQASLRTKIKHTLHVDLTRRPPLDPPRTYPLVTSFYCADSITASKDQWRGLINNLFTLVAPGGLLIMSALRRAEHYEITYQSGRDGHRRYPSANVDENDIADVLQHGGFEPATIDLQVVRFLGDSYKDREPGFEGIVLASARKLPG